MQLRSRWSFLYSDGETGDERSDRVVTEMWTERAGCEQGSAHDPGSAGLRKKVPEKPQDPNNPVPDKIRSYLAGILRF